MKKIIIITLAISFFVMINAFAEDVLKELRVKSTPQCEMCVSRIEKGLKRYSGIEDVKVLIDSALIVVQYNPEDIEPDKIRTAISKLGYKADDVKADPKAYAKFPNCCKLPEDRK